MLGESRDWWGFGRQTKRLWKPPDRCRHAWLRREASHELFDLALRLPCCLGQHKFMVLVSQMRHEQTQPGQMHPPAPEFLDQGWELPPRPRYRDPVVSDVLGAVELAHAKREHRGKGQVEIELALVDLGEVKKQLRLDDTRCSQERARRREKFTIPQALHRRMRLDHDRSRSTGV